MSNTRRVVGILACVLASLMASDHRLRAQQADAQAQPGPTDTFEGILGIVWGDPHPDLSSASGVHYTLTLPDGRTLVLQLTRQDGEAAFYFGKRVLVSGRAVQAPGAAAAITAGTTIVVESIALSSGLQAEPAAAVLGVRRVIYLLVKFPDDSAVPHPPAFYTNMTNPDTPPGGEVFPTTLNGFFKKTSYDHFSWEADVGGVGGVGAPGGWLTLPHPKNYYAPCNFSVTCAAGKLNELANDATALGRAQGINFKVYNNINFVLSNDLDCCAWGGGYFSSVDNQSYGATWEPPWGQEATTYAHEMGHSLGLPHSGWVYYAYDSPWDVMSGRMSASSVLCGSYFSINSGTTNNLSCSSPGNGYIAAHRDYLGWIPAASQVVTDTTTSVSVTLEGLALPLSSAVKLIKICIAGVPCTGSTARYYTVEARVKGLDATSQYDNAIPNEGVIIHDVRLNRSAIGGPCFFNSQSGWAVPIDATPGDYNSSTCSPIGSYPNHSLFNAQWSPGQTYTNGFRISVISRSGSNFVVSVAPVGSLPIVTTGAASAVTATTATLNGTVDPNGFPTFALFEYGLTTAYGNPTPGQSVGAGPIPGGAISGLTCNTVYHFRARATNINGTSLGADATFTTLACPPAASTGFASFFTSTSAILAGTANPNGAPTTAWFEYGTTTAYGSTTPVQNVGSGVSPQIIAGGSVTGLTCGTVYHFRATATNAGGTANGADTTFSPPCDTSAPPRLFGVSNGSNAALVFNASSLSAVATIPLPNETSYDAVVMPNQSLAFVARSTGIWVIDLTQNPPALAAGVNPIPSPIVSNVQDMSLTPDGRFLLVTDGNGASPIGVIDTATRATVGTFSFLPDHNSVEVCDNGSVLVTSVLTSVVKRLTISGTGMLADTGQSLGVPLPNNVTCAFGGTVGVVVDRMAGEIRSFLVNGMTLVSNQVLAGFGIGINVAISRDGAKVFGRRADGFLTAYTFDSTTGAIGAQLWSTFVGSAPTFFGSDQIAVHPDGRRIFTSSSPVVLALDAATGAVNGSAPIINSIGLALRPTMIVAGDFDGDGKSDLLLRNKSTGQNIGWLMNGLTVATATFMPTIADTNWEVRGRGDFDGDGKADVIWRNKSTGQDIGWLMNGLTVSTAAFMPTIADTNWEIRGVGDFDGDGKADVILRNRSTGQNIGWLMNGLTVSLAAFMPTIADTNWEIVGVGDFNADGKADVLLRNKSTGQNIGWLMNGLTVSLAAFMPTIADTNWEIRGVRDFDGDGKADVILRNKSTGQNIGWLMNGLTVSLAAFLPTIADTNWEIKGAGDFDGDGRADVILRNKSTGQDIGWLMNGLTVSTSAFMPTIADTNWDFVGHGQ